jgi:hypothetical protein
MENQNNKDIIKTLEYYFVTKAPFHIPANIKELIVKLVPWGNVIYLVIIAPIILALIGLGTLVQDITGQYYRHTWSISSLVSAIILVLIIVTTPGLFKRNIKSWTFMFYEIVISSIGGLFVGNRIYFGDIIGVIIGFVIGAYVWFQVKSYYS